MILAYHRDVIREIQRLEIQQKEGSPDYPDSR
jgi:hypothetical protein